MWPLAMHKFLVKLSFLPWAFFALALLMTLVGEAPLPEPGSRPPEPGSIPVPEPLVVTTAQIAEVLDPRDPLQSLLVTVRGAKLTSEPDVLDDSAAIDDGSGAALLCLEHGLFGDRWGLRLLDRAGIKIGSCYDITGIVWVRGSTEIFPARTFIFPRTLADIVEVPCG